MFVIIFLFLQTSKKEKDSKEDVSTTETVIPKDLSKLSTKEKMKVSNLYLEKKGFFTIMLCNTNLVFVLI